ncbi:N-acylneuraminate-9-phosphatase-like [Uranotaenia lowii]|uniref:N-acylneuraminate-9-phosphatase-like n=1 Tax=Uranotaenia lowii TaxID=190385 RepID=UPI0024789571|nr:N-acylneuraminate-9-phosphatase-like [Uranotaenia lowii]
MATERCDIIAKPITTIFFDLDNTLIPTRKGDAKACSKIADLLQNEHDLSRDLAIEASTTFLSLLRRCPDNPEFPLAQWRIQLWEDALPVDCKHLAPEIYPRWLEYRIRYQSPGSNIISMLQSLHLRYNLGIITNGPSAAQWEKIDKLGLEHFFDCILVSSDLPWAKPNRNIFYAACHYLNVQPEECVMIGDKLETDVQGGIESKLGATVWLPLPADLHLGHDRSLADIEEQYRPDYILSSVLDLPNILPRSGVSFGSRASTVNLQQKTTRNRSASYNRFLPDVPDLFSSSSNSCDSTASMDGN